MPQDKQSLVDVVEPAVPDMIAMTRDMLLGGIWKRPGLSPRDRSMATICTLIATGRWEPLPEHFELGRKNGLSDEEISELITHLAFYAGWPSAMSAAHIALDTLKINLREAAGASR